MVKKVLSGVAASMVAAGLMLGSAGVASAAVPAGRIASVPAGRIAVASDGIKAAGIKAAAATTDGYKWTGVGAGVVTPTRHW